MQVTQQVQKWGNGTGIRLPKRVIEAAHLQLGQSVVVNLRGSSIVLTPIKAVPSELPSLQRLLDGVTPAQVGGELYWGPDQGHEWLDG